MSFSVTGFMSCLIQHMSGILKPGRSRSASTVFLLMVWGGLIICLNLCSTPDLVWGYEMMPPD